MNEEVKMTNEYIGGTFGAKKVIWKNDVWIYKKSYAKYEVAAYQVYEAIKPFLKGYWYVPKTVFLNETKEISMQRFATNTIEGWQIKKSNVGCYMMDSITATEISAFDYLIQQSDRHDENYMIDLVGQVVLIDHGLCFYKDYFSTVFSRYINEDRIVDYWKPAWTELNKIAVIFDLLDFDLRWKKITTTIMGKI